MAFGMGRGFFEPRDEGVDAGAEQRVGADPVAVGDGDGVGVAGQAFERGGRQRGLAVRHDQAVDAVAHQLAIGGQVGQQRDAAVRHRLEHRDRDGIAARHAHVPARAGVERGLRGGVEAADELDAIGQAERRGAARFSASLSEPLLATTSRASGQRGRDAGEQRQHALRIVDVLEPAVGEEQARLLGCAARRAARRGRTGTSSPRARRARACAAPCARSRWCRPPRRAARATSPSAARGCCAARRGCPSPTPTPPAARARPRLRASHASVPCEVR